VVTRIEDPKGKGRVRFQADDGFSGQFAKENPPDVGIGDTTEVYVANVSPHSYTFTLRPPKNHKN